MFFRMYNYLRLSRPYYVIPVIAASIAGYLSGPNTHLTIIKGGTVGFVFLLLGMACWAANEITDRDLDGKGKTKQKWGLYVSGGTGILSSGIFTVKSVFVYILVLAFTGLFIAFLLGTNFFILSMFFLVIGLIYSLKPIRLKDRGIFGLAAVSVAYGMVPFMAGCVSKNQIPSMESILFAGMLSITFLGFEGLGHLLDHDQDFQNHENTISVSLGQEMARKILAICQCLPALILCLLSLLANPLVPHLNKVLLFPFLLISCLFSLFTVKYSHVSLTSSQRVISVPLLSIFAFAII